MAARYGGDEFVCVLPGADLDQAAMVAGRLRQRFAERLANSASTAVVQTAVAAGVAVFPLHGNSPEALLAVADADLINTKATDRVTLQIG